MPCLARNIGTLLWSSYPLPNRHISERFSGLIFFVEIFVKQEDSTAF
jgi:hypothetical protein